MGKLNEIYEKDIAREIQGVIKVDDENYIKQELEEYVVTDELLKHFNSFFESYNAGINGNTEKMGVWISGFFGSGKSHFLKIVSYLLENKIVDGKAAVDYFDGKIQDAKLLADIKRAGNISTDVILFNIDSKASLDSVDGKDKILAVFEKVFNEKMGLSTIPHVAELERFLIREGKYEEFKNYFQEECGDNWVDARNDFYFRRDEIVNSYSKALNKSKEEAENWFDKAEERYDLSIEKFAERVRDYIKSKGDNHHVVFLVDEIGQYIGEDGSLMLNLQTIVEDLGIECGGKAWVIVTSQEAIDDVIKVIGNNFSKIQGRFDTKLSLSSSDIDEVIKKRILAKKEEYTESLELIYDKDESIIKNLLSFKNAASQKLYMDRIDFAETYPFIPYQFRLLQNVFTNIRKSGFAGKHLSSGERSLIGAFQGTAKRYSNGEIGTLIPFYAFYDTIEEFLEHQVKNVIATAEDAVKANELQEIDVKVLKMLFMLKNIKEIPANVENLSSLYVSNINDDKISIKKEITDSLRRLENQTLIQRNNDEYKFLTDEEQEINREIKQIVIDQNRITDYLNKIIYGYIYTDNKFTYKNKPFPLTKYVDNAKCSQEYEIGIKVVTTSVGQDDTNIKIQSGMENKFVYVKLELPTLTNSEIENCLQVADYRRAKSTSLQTSQVESILRAKQAEVEAAEVRIRENIKEQLNEAEIIIAGDRQNITTKDAKARINEALEILINNIYTKFAYIKKNYTTQDIRELWNGNKQMTLSKEVEFLNQKAYEAMQDYIEEKNAFSQNITIRTLLQDFTIAPYGFLDDDILYLLARLLKNEVVALYYSGEIQNITSDETLNKILKRDYYDRTLIKMRKKIDVKYINDLKSVARNSFNEISLSDDEDGMIRDFKERCIGHTIDKLRDILGNYNNIKAYQYPGKQVIEDALMLFNSISNIRDTSEVFEEVSSKKDEIAEITPKIDTISEFFKGSQKEQFDKVRDTIITYENNKDYVDNTQELKDVVGKILDILKAEEPYSSIHELPTLRSDLISILVDMYEKKSAPIIEMANKTIEYIENELNNAGINPDDFGKGYIDNCKRIIDSLQHSNELKDIYAQETRLGQMKDSFIIALDKKKYEMSKPKDDNTKSDEPVIIKTRKIVRTDMLMNRSYEINSKEDIDKYIEELRNKLMKELEENNNLTIK